MLRLSYLVAIAFIVLAATVGWFILGGTLVERTESADRAQRAALAGLWGSELVQRQPAFVRIERRGATGSLVAPASSRIGVTLSLALRRKGLLWYPGYFVDFGGTYVVRAPGARAVRMNFVLPSESATYDDVAVTAGGRNVPVTNPSGLLSAEIALPRGGEQAVTVRYRTRGVGTWTYRFGDGVVTTRDLALTMRTDFRTIDLPGHTLAPTSERETPDGWELGWNYHELVTGAGVGMVFPTPLQPGPLAARLTFWAPLSLCFYVFVMLVITALRRIELHPINYLFLAAAFFAFDLLFAYTVDRIRVEYAFVICAAVSMGLTISYLRLVAGLRFAAVEAAGAQLFYQILFSLALFDEGYSGLSITIGAIVTLFVIMQLTGRIRWSERFAAPAAPLPAS